MAFKRSAQFNANIDPNMLKWLQAAAGQYTGPYDIDVFSGYRPGDRRQHGVGHAADIRLIDPKTGKELNNYQDAASFAEYQKVANLVRQQQMAMNPEYAQRLRWGGYFGGGAGKYGAMDLMHFDVGGSPELGMAGGGWDTGLTEAQAKQWGLNPGGGISATAASGQPSTGPYSVEQQQAAMLRAIREMESGGRYNALYGPNKSFEDMSRHPDVRTPIGPATEGNYTSAAGAYQFISPTWATYAKKLGLTDFSAASQDKAAWDLALTTLGGEAGLADQSKWAEKLGSQWEAIKKDPTKFNSLYNQYLGGAQAVPGTDVTTTPKSPTTPATGATPAAAATPKKKGWQDLISGMAEGFGTGPGGGGGSSPTTPPLPVQALPSMASAPVSSIDPQAREMQRQQLAQAMARLNSGKLYG